MTAGQMLGDCQERARINAEMEERKVCMTGHSRFLVCPGH